MSERPDLRQITKQVDEALDGYSADELRAMLVHVFKEYVVEGQPAYLVHQTESIGELEALTFAEIITTLQTRLELPELANLQVSDQVVKAKVGGVWQTIDSTSAAPEPAPVPEPAPAPMRTAPTTGPAPAAATPAPAAAPSALAASKSESKDDKSDSPKKPEPKAEPTGDDDASQRFSLLELD